MSKLTREDKEKRMSGLEQQAIDWYLDKTDFDVTEWLSVKEKIEYLKLYKEINGICLFCGESIECQCDYSK